VVSITKSHSLTTILIAHRLSTIKTASKLVFIEDGRVAEEGSFAELSARDSRFNALVQNQMLARAPQKQEDAIVEAAA
jgi:ABC-type multidrug transport system fused ATPase/permease subunit